MIIPHAGTPSRSAPRIFVLAPRRLARRARRLARRFRRARRAEFAGAKWKESLLEQSGIVSCDMLRPVFG